MYPAYCSLPYLMIPSLVLFLPSPSMQMVNFAAMPHHWQTNSVTCHWNVQ